MRLASEVEENMIYTLTVNPAVDYHMDLSGTGFMTGRINRSEAEEALPGGKGLNVSVMLARLGCESVAWGFTAGKIGDLLEGLAKENGCSCDFIRLAAGETRINVKLDCENETAVNGKGPDITETAILKLLEKAASLSEGDTLVLCGNLQAGAGDLYGRLCEEAQARHVRLIVDTEGSALRDVLRFQPFLIKPNEEELLGLFPELWDPEEAVFEKSCSSGRDGAEPWTPDHKTAGLILRMRQCQELGARNILLSCGSDGAWLLTEKGSLYHALLQEKRAAVSTVGAGDSMLAGFLASLSRDRDDMEKALKLACAAGSATAYSRWLGSGALAEELRETIRVSAVTMPGQERACARTSRLAFMTER